MYADGERDAGGTRTDRSLERMATAGSRRARTFRSDVFFSYQLARGLLTRFMFVFMFMFMCGRGMTEMLGGNSGAGT